MPVIGSFVERKGAITHHRIARSGGVARVAQIEKPGARSTPRRGNQKAIDRIGPTGLMMRERRRPEGAHRCVIQAQAPTPLKNHVRMSARELAVRPCRKTEESTHAPYEVRKGTIRFPLSQPVPVKLIERIAKFRAKETTERAKAKAAAPKKR